MLAGAVGMGTAAFFDPALIASPAFDKIMASLVISGVTMEAGAIATALTSNRGMTITTRQAAANRQIIYGQQRVGGIMIYQSTTGSSHDQWNAVIVLAGHECESIQNLYLDGRQVHWLGSGDGYSVRNGVGFGGVADSNTYTGPDGLQYNFGGTGHSGIYCEARYGDQAEGDVIAALTANDPNWAADGKGNSPWVAGCCYIYLKIEYNTAVFPQFPEIRVTVNGKNNIWDPRTQTYGFTSNWALIAADVITDTQFGLGDNSVNQLQLIAAANVCDEQIELEALSGQTEAQYTTNYHYDTSAAPGDVLQAMMPGAAGRISRIGGEWFLYPAYWQGPSFTYDESFLTAPVSWKSYRSVRDLINRINGTYIAPTYPFNIAGNLYDQNLFYDGQQQNNFPFAFQPTNFPQYAADTLHGYPADEYLAEDGGIQRPLELALSTVLSVTQAQRVAKINLLKNRFQGTGSLEMTLAAFSMQPTDVFQMTFPQMAWANKVLEVNGVSFSVQQDQDGGAPSVRMSLTVNETDPSIYEWTPAAEELTVYDVPASPSQVSPVPAPPTSMSLVSGPSVAQINPDGTVNNIIEVQWDTPLDILAVGIMIQYQQVGASSWLSAPNTAISLNYQWISNVVPGQSYNVQIASYRASGVTSSWVAINNYQVIANTNEGTLAAQLPVIAANSQLAGTAAGEMLTNGNFSNGSTGNVAGWALVSGGGQLTISTAEFKNATRSLNLSNQIASQTVQVVADRTYLLQFWVMTDGNVVTTSGFGAGAYVSPASGTASLLASNAPGNHISSSILDIELPATQATPWTLLQMVFTVSASGSMGVSLTNSIGGGVVAGTAFFDGVSLTDVTAQSNQLGGNDASLITPIINLMPSEAGADVTANQPIVYAGSSESIVPNGNLVLGTAQGWVLTGFTLGPGNGFGINLYSPQNAANNNVLSPSFSVVPGAKYRLVFSCYNGNSGTGGIVFRVAWGSTYAANIPASNSPVNYQDFLDNGTVSGAPPTNYAYDWVAPAGANYASMLAYCGVNGGTSDLAVQMLACVPYAATGQWGADVTNQNTSNDTSNVDGVPSSTIAQVVPTGYELFINSGQRTYEIEAL